ncbi:hypothetical protein ABIA39_007050 [Nocardia sp. GAS34]|uniref:transposase n=1 Tax=unclassified Nocardia TaxID=2637762 RepID=UPI003D211452
MRAISSLTEILEGLRLPQLRQPELVEKALGRQAMALLVALDTACAGAADLEQAAAEEFRKHLDHAIITSFPGLADLTGARVPAEIGDDRTKFATDRALKAYAGSAPVTAHPARRSPSPTAESRTTARPPPAGSGHSPPPVDTAPPASTTNAVEHTETGTRRHCGTCSARCSDSSTTASNLASHSIPSKPSVTQPQHRPRKLPLDF